MNVKTAVLGGESLEYHEVTLKHSAITLGLNESQVAGSSTCTVLTRRNACGAIELCSKPHLASSTSWLGTSKGCCDIYTFVKVSTPPVNCSISLWFVTENASQ